MFRILCTSIAAAALAAAQAAPQGDVPVFHAGKQLVNLYASVLDSKGKLLGELPKTAFKVYEKRMLSAMVPSNRKLSCITTPR